jgi:hypothetical protein
MIKGKIKANLLISYIHNLEKEIHDYESAILSINNTIALDSSNLLENKAYQKLKSCVTDIKRELNVIYSFEITIETNDAYSEILKSILGVTIL